VRGRDLLTGLPRLLTLREEEMPEALEESCLLILDAIRSVLEQTPPEMVADISHTGITLTGG
jgi:rod shape-determining protein MreB